MTTSKLARAIARAEVAIEANTTRRAHREALRHDLLDVVALRRTSRRLLRVAPHLSDDGLLDRLGYVSAALHAIAHHGLSVASAARMARLTEQDIVFALALLERCGRSLAWVHEHVDDGVRAAIDASTQRLVVELAPSAIAELVSASIEAVAQRAGPTEVFGELYGTTVIGPLDERSERLHTVSVTRFALQAKARATDCSVTPSRTSHRVHQLVARELYDDGSSIVGFAHSHPWSSATELKANRGWQYSKDDEQHSEGWQAGRTAAGQRGYVSLIVAVAPGSKGGARARRLARNRLGLRIGRWHLVVAAFRLQLDGDLDASLHLKVPTLLHQPVIATLGASEIYTTRSQLFSSRSIS